MLGVVEWGIYPYISMGTTMSMMLLFTQVVKDTQRDCGQPHHSFQKTPYWFKLNPGIFKLKRGLEHFQNLWSKGGVVHDRLLCAKVMHFKTKTH